MVIRSEFSSARKTESYSASPSNVSKSSISDGSLITSSSVFSVGSNNSLEFTFLFISIADFFPKKILLNIKTNVTDIAKPKRIIIISLMLIIPLLI